MMGLKVLLENQSGHGILIEKNFSVSGQKITKRLTENENMSSTNKVSQYVITGIYAQGDVQNRNGRIYPFNDVLKPEFDSYITESVNRNRAPMELSHPDNLDINSDRVCSRIRKMWFEGTDVYGEAVVGSRNCGGIVRDYIDMGLEFGVSTRGSGSVENGIVQNDFKLYYIDVVLNPSAPDAYMKHQFESKANAMYKAGVTEQELEKIEEDIKKFPKDAKKAQLAVENLISKLSKIYK